MLMINCDLGECLTPNPDVEVMPLIDMANIACGGHAGDDKSMVDAIKLAVKNNVKIGAHPAYNDRENFGRLSANLSNTDLYNLIYSQVKHFQDLCLQNNAKLEYIKPHGGLYHDMMQKPEVMQVIINVVSEIDRDLDLVVQAGHDDYLKNFGKNANNHFLHEVFADRSYDGIHMRARGDKNAVHDTMDKIIVQYREFLISKTFKIDTICFHGDNLVSVEALKQIKNA